MPCAPWSGCRCADLNGFLMLQHGRVDYVVAYRATTAELLREHPELAGSFQAVGTVHQPELYLSFSRSGTGRLAAAAFRPGHAAHPGRRSIPGDP